MGALRGAVFLTVNLDPCVDGRRVSAAGAVNLRAAKVILTQGTWDRIMAGMGIGYAFPLAPGSVAAELGASSEPSSGSQGYGAAH